MRLDCVLSQYGRCAEARRKDAGLADKRCTPLYGLFAQDGRMLGARALHRHSRRQADDRAPEGSVVLGRGARIKFYFGRVTVATARSADVGRGRQEIALMVVLVAAGLCVFRQMSLFGKAVAGQGSNGSTARREQIHGEKQQRYVLPHFHFSKTPHSSRRAIHALASIRAVASSTL